MVEKDRGKRYPSAAELRGDLEALAEGRYRGRAEVFRDEVKPGRRSAVRRKSSVQLKRVRGPRGARRPRGGGLILVLAGLPVAAAIIFLFAAKGGPSSTSSGRGRNGAAGQREDARAAGPQAGSSSRGGRRGPERPGPVDDDAPARPAEAPPRTPKAAPPQAVPAAKDFVSEARARAEELVSRGRYGRALEDGGPIDAKLAPARARREIGALRREVYAKANAELKRRIEESADPVLEFDIITEGMPKSLVDQAGKKLGVEEEAGK
jgi:hypothetical protein